MKKYIVMRGQYEKHAYPEESFDSLHAAKCYATKHMEYWDNWQGWHIPPIFLSEDCEEITARNWLTVRDGTTIIVPRDDIYVHAAYSKLVDDKKWQE